MSNENSITITDTNVEVEPNPNTQDITQLQDEPSSSTNESNNVGLEAEKYSDASHNDTLREATHVLNGSLRAELANLSVSRHKLSDETMLNTSVSDSSSSNWLHTRSNGDVTGDEEEFVLKILGDDDDTLDNSVEIEGKFTLQELLTPDEGEIDTPQRNVRNGSMSNVRQPVTSNAARRGSSAQRKPPAWGRSSPKERLSTQKTSTRSNASSNRSTPFSRTNRSTPTSRASPASPSSPLVPINAAGMELQSHLQQIERGLRDSEWSRRVGALRRLHGIAIGTSIDMDKAMVAKAVSSMRMLLEKQVCDLRSAVSRAACECVIELASKLGFAFSSTALHLAAVLSEKVVNSRTRTIADCGDRCLLRLCETQRLKCTLPVLMRLCTGADTTLRRKVPPYICGMLNSGIVTPQTEDTFLRQIERAVCVLLGDRDEATRKKARLLYQLYEEKLPQRASANIGARLPQHVLKYLNTGTTSVPSSTPSSSMRSSPMSRTTTPSSTTRNIRTAMGRTPTSSRTTPSSATPSSNGQNSTRVARKPYVSPYSIASLKAQSTANRERRAMLKK